mmetsp:Transcript_39894/g.45506  ORF Transcript_39894/g.45506 Transcript_39894/m.45506 type:complete len:854 (-) Transcript_39894:4528-7089(-)
MDNLTEWRLLRRQYNHYLTRGMSPSQSNLKRQDRPGSTANISSRMRLSSGAKKQVRFDLTGEKAPTGEVPRDFNPRVARQEKERVLREIVHFRENSPSFQRPSTTTSVLSTTSFEPEASQRSRGSRTSNASTVDIKRNVQQERSLAVERKQVEKIETLGKESEDNSAELDPRTVSQESEKQQTNSSSSAPSTSNMRTSLDLSDFDVGKTSINFAPGVLKSVMEVTNEEIIKEKWTREMLTEISNKLSELINQKSQEWIYKYLKKWRMVVQSEIERDRKLKEDEKEAERRIEEERKQKEKEKEEGEQQRDRAQDSYEDDQLDHEDSDAAVETPKFMLTENQFNFSKGVPEIDSPKEELSTQVISKLSPRQTVESEENHGVPNLSNEPIILSEIDPERPQNLENLNLQSHILKEEEDEKNSPTNDQHFPESSVKPENIVPKDATLPQILGDQGDVTVSSDSYATANDVTPDSIQDVDLECGDNEGNIDVAEEEKLAAVDVNELVTQKFVSQEEQAAKKLEEIEKQKEHLINLQNQLENQRLEEAEREQEAEKEHQAKVHYEFNLIFGHFEAWRFFLEQRKYKQQLRVTMRAHRETRVKQNCLTDWKIFTAAEKERNQELSKRAESHILNKGILRWKLALEEQRAEEAKMRKADAYYRRKLKERMLPVALASFMKFSKMHKRWLKQVRKRLSISKLALSLKHWKLYVKYNDALRFLTVRKIQLILEEWSNQAKVLQYKRMVAERAQVHYEDEMKSKALLGFMQYHRIKAERESTKYQGKQFEDHRKFELRKKLFNEWRGILRMVRKQKYTKYESLKSNSDYIPLKISSGIRVEKKYHGDKVFICNKQSSRVEISKK